MTQDAVVTKLLPDGMAEVAVARSTACGGSCGHCESCVFQSELKTPARNLIQARPGQNVIIASHSATVFKAAALVYVVPMVLLLAGYAAAALAGAGEGLCIAASFLGLALGAVLVVLSQRLRKGKSPIAFDIVSLDDGSGDGKEKKRGIL